MGRRRALLRDLATALVWTTVAVLAGAVAWSAVSRLGQDGAALASGRALGPGEVQRALQHAQPSPGSVPTRPSSPRDQGKPRGQGSSTSRSWQVVGGTVAVSCRGTVAELLYAVPADGWAYRLGSAVPGALEVEFARTGGLSRLVVRCAGGSPTRVSSGVTSAVPGTVRPAETQDGGEGSGD
jgi:hypothetical protein